MSIMKVDFELALGLLIQQHESQGPDRLIEALDLYVGLLEEKRDHSVSGSSVSEKEN